MWLGATVCVVWCGVVQDINSLVNSLNTKTHSSKEMTEFCSEDADVKGIC